ncbi:MAG: hypothetical protein GY838_00280 [bacterium]|nr:hypothetical protein [bacterium]
MEPGKPSTETKCYRRGRLESRFVHAASPDAAEENTDLAVLLRRYYDYRVWRLIRGYILSSNNDKRSLRKLVQTVVRVGFSILLAESRDEARDADRILVTTDFSCRRIENQPPQFASEKPVEPSSAGFALGQASIGRDIALGSNPAESVWTVTIDVELKMAQAVVLQRRPEVVDGIMKALERAVPLNLDYVLCFHVDEDDYVGLLFAVDGTKREAGEFPPVLGLNSALGRIRE